MCCVCARVYVFVYVNVCMSIYLCVFFACTVCLYVLTLQVQYACMYVLRVLEPNYFDTYSIIVKISFHEFIIFLFPDDSDAQVYAYIIQYMLSHMYTYLHAYIHTPTMKH